METMKYGAFLFGLFGKIIQYSVSKITQTKSQQFLTILKKKRGNNRTV